MSLTGFFQSFIYLFARDSGGEKCSMSNNGLKLIPQLVGEREIASLIEGPSLLFFEKYVTFLTFT